MKEKLNLTCLTKMTKKDLQATKGGLICVCHCICYIYPDGTSDIDGPKEWKSSSKLRAGG
jgi:natural product precursor